MIKLYDQTTGKTYAYLRCLQQPPNFKVIGMGLYLVDHDFQKTKKPAQFFPQKATTDNEAVKLVIELLEKTEGRMPTDEELQAYVAGKLDSLPSVEDSIGDPIDPPENIDWEQLAFPEDFEKNPPPAIFRHPPVQM